MLFFLPLLLSCSDPVVDVPKEAPLPVGEPLLSSCFGEDLIEEVSLVQPSPFPAAAPSGAKSKSADASKSGKARMEELKQDVTKKTLLQLIGTAGEGGSGSEIGDLLGGSADIDAALAGAGIGVADDGGSVKPSEDPAEVAVATYAEPVQQPEVDWGAKIYLSNDDSMSLASAQRVLWALKHNRFVSTSQIRPHELLNYFSFDTEPVKKGDLFSVQGTAEQNEDTLSLALSVKGATLARRPLDLTLVIDRSGSMSGEGRMDYTKKGLIQLTDNLVRGDRVDVVLFESGVCTPVEGFVVGRDDPEILLDPIRKLAPMGSTDLDRGLREAYRIQAGRQDVDQRNRRVVLITDAQLNTGNVNVDLVSEVGRQFEENNIRLTGVGVGSDFNDKMLDKLTEKGKGAYVYLGSEAVVERVFGVGFHSLTQTIAHDVRFALQLPDSLAMERFYGEESSTNPEDVQPINYYAGTSQLFLQDLKIKEGQLANDQQLVLSIEYIDAVSGEASTRQFTMKVGELLDSDHRNVNKAQALMAFSDVLLARSMGNSEGCTAGLDTYKERAAEVGEDAEVAYVDSLVANMDCSNLQMPGVSAGGPTVRPIPTFLSSSDGARGADEVKRTVRRYTGQLRYCGDRMLRDGESVAGKLNLSMQILEGRVVEVEVKKNGTGSDKLGACTTNKAKRWRFPETAAGTFVYEIKFVVK